MIRKQLYLDADLDHALKRLSARTGESEAAHVRAALRAYLADLGGDEQQDPLAELAGLVDEPDGPVDVAEHHDRYLYEAAEPPSRYHA